MNQQGSLPNYCRLQEVGQDLQYLETPKQFLFGSGLFSYWGGIEYYPKRNYIGVSTVGTWT